MAEDIDRCEYRHMPQEATPSIYAAAGLNCPVVVAASSRHAVASCRSHEHFKPAAAYNALKGPNLSSIDPQTGDRVNVFNPCIDDWAGNFALSRGIILGLAPIGRAAARLLKMGD